MFSRFLSKVSLAVPVFKNAGERSTAKNYHLVSLLSVVSKVFEKLVNNRIVDHLQKCGLFSDFQYGFRFSQSTVDVLTAVSDRSSRLLTDLALLEQQHLKHPRLLTEFGMLVFFKLKSYGISGQIFGLVSYFLMMLSVILLSMTMILLSILSQASELCNVANSDRSSAIANHLGLLVSQNGCRFLKITKHNYCVNVYLDKIFVLFTS